MPLGHQYFVKQMHIILEWIPWWIMTQVHELVHYVAIGFGKVFRPNGNLIAEIVTTGVTQKLNTWPNNPEIT